MNKIILLLVLCIFLAGCSSTNKSDSNGKENLIGNEPAEAMINDMHEQKVIDEVSLDTNDDHLEVLYIGKENDGFVQIRSNSSEYTLKDFRYDEKAFDTEPKLHVLQSEGAKKHILLSASYKINGGTDGCYDAYVFEYNHGNIAPIWRSAFPPEDITHKYSNRELTLELAGYDIRHKIMFEENQVKEMLKGKDESILSEAHSVVLREAENFGYLDYDNDGIMELFTQTPIYFDPTNRYLGSLYVVFGAEESGINVKKSFVLDRKSIKARLLKEIIDHGTVTYGEWGETLDYWINSGENGYTEKDIENSVSELVEQGILLRGVNGGRFSLTQ